jgi:PIN domain nuclease of toxin-antitoxin system
VRLLVDTHVLLWVLQNSRRMAPAARAALGADGAEVFVSAASGWEIGIKAASGKLRAPDDLLAEVTASGFIVLPITLEDGLAAGALPRHHTDPFDRMLVAQAIARQLTLVTVDAALERYGVDCLRAN